MRRYIVNARVTISMLTHVDANSKSEAIEIAQERPVMTLCHCCGGSDGIDEQWVTSGELDGEPTKPKARAES